MKRAYEGGAIPERSMAFVSVAFLAAVAAPAWPLANVRTVMAQGELLTSAGTKAVQEWYQFAAGPPHCDFRQRIDYPASKVIEIVSPKSDTISKVLFTNSSIYGQRCTTTGPNPFPKTQCINELAAMGSMYNFAGKQPCPAPSTFKCDLWTAETRTSNQTFLFVSGTARVVQYSFTTGSTSVITYSELLVNETIPKKAWKTPASWGPCTPGRSMRTNTADENGMSPYFSL
jgi:hypothetical protein